eukprot:48813-Hanusia_phi.AAC.1
MYNSQRQPTAQQATRKADEKRDERNEKRVGISESEVSNALMKKQRCLVALEEEDAQEEDMILALPAEKREAVRGVLGEQKKKKILDLLKAARGGRAKRQEDEDMEMLKFKKSDEVLARVLERDVEDDRQVRSIIKDCKSKGEVEKFGISVFSSLWKQMSTVANNKGFASAWEIAARQQDAAQRILSSKRAELESQRTILLQLVSISASSLSSSFDSESPSLVRVRGPHGCGVSVLLALCASQARKLMSSSSSPPDPSSLKIFYVRLEPWHTRNFLQWYLCCCIAETTCHVYNWRKMSELAQSRSSAEKAFLLFIDGISSADFADLSSTLRTMRRNRVRIFAVVSLADRRASIAHAPGSTDVSLLPLSAPEAQQLATHVIRDLSKTFMWSFAIDKTSVTQKISEIISSGSEQEAAVFSNPLYVVGISIMIAHQQDVPSLPGDLTSLWMDCFFPLLERTYGRTFISSLFLTLHYEPMGLTRHQFAVEEKALGEEKSEGKKKVDKDLIAHGDVLCNIGYRCETVFSSLSRLLNAVISPGSCGFNVQHYSMKKAIEMRYFETWKQKEEEAIKPSLVPRDRRPSRSTTMTGRQPQSSKSLLTKSESRGEDESNGEFPASDNSNLERPEEQEETSDVEEWGEEEGAAGAVEALEGVEGLQEEEEEANVSEQLEEHEEAKEEVASGAGLEARQEEATGSSEAKEETKE